MSALGRFRLISLITGLSCLSYLPLLAQYQSQLIPYKTASSWGYSDTTGTIRIKPQFAKAGLFYSGKALVSVRVGEQCLLDSNGRYVIPPDCHWSGLALTDMRHASLNARDSAGRYGLVDLQGRLRIPFLYESARGYYASQNTRFEKRGNRDTWFMIVSRGGKYGVIDTLNRAIVPLEYDQIIGPDTYDSLYGWGVRRGSFWGALRPDGSSLLPLQYDTVGPLYTRGLFIVRYKGKAGIIDSLGNWRTPAAYDDIRADRNWNNDQLWKSGFLLTRGRRSGWAAVDGGQIIPPEYDYVQSLQNSRYLNSYIIRGDKTVSTLFDTGGRRLAGPYRGDFRFSADTVFLSKPKLISGGRRRLRIYCVDMENGKLVFQREVILPKWRGLSEEMAGRRHSDDPGEPIDDSPGFFDSAGIKLQAFYADGRKWHQVRLISRETRANTGVQSQQLAVVRDYRGLYAIADSQRRFLIRPQARFDIRGGVYSENWLVVKSDSGFAIADTTLRLLTAHSSRLPVSYFRFKEKGYTISRAQPGEAMPGGESYHNSCPLCECTHLYDAAGLAVKTLERYCFPHHVDSSGIASSSHPTGVFSVIDTGMRRGLVRMDGTILYPELSFRYKYMRVLTPSVIAVSNKGDYDLRLMNASRVELVPNREIKHIFPAMHDGILVPGPLRQVEDSQLFKVTYIGEENRYEEVYINRNGRVYADPEIF